MSIATVCLTLLSTDAVVDERLACSPTSFASDSAHTGTRRLTVFLVDLPERAVALLVIPMPYVARCRCCCRYRREQLLLRLRMAIATNAANRTFLLRVFHKSS